jgi:hypothetical protein
VSKGQISSDAYFSLLKLFGQIGSEVNIFWVGKLPQQFPDYVHKIYLLLRWLQTETTSLLKNFPPWPLLWSIYCWLLKFTMCSVYSVLVLTPNVWFWSGKRFYGIEVQTHAMEFIFSVSFNSKCLVLKWKKVLWNLSLNSCRGTRIIYIQQVHLKVLVYYDM